MKTVLPSPLSRFIRFLMSTTPGGISPFAGSSRMSELGIGDQAGSDREPLLHAQRVLLELAARVRREIDQTQHGVDLS